MLRTALLPVLLITAAFAAHAPAARADMMSACSAEIGRFCTDVSRGRGRISACLAAEIGKLGAECRSEVQAVARGPLTPRSVRRIFDPSFRAPLPQVCVTPAAQFCPAIPTGDGRVFACLYARSDRVPKACSDAMQAAAR